MQTLIFIETKPFKYNNLSQTTMTTYYFLKFIILTFSLVFLRLLFYFDDWWYSVTKLTAVAVANNKMNITQIKKKEII